MVKINFKEFKLYVDVTRENTRVFDVRKDFSNFMYLNCRGIQAHDIALRIYHSDGDVEFDDSDVAVIKSAANMIGGPLIDSLPLNISE